MVPPATQEREYTGPATSLAPVQLVAESVYRLGRERHNFYAVVDRGRVTVVDAGGSRELPLLRSGLESIGLDLSAVAAVLLTHAHSAHIGFAREVAESGVPVKVHEREAAYATDGSRGRQVQPMELPIWRRQTLAFLIEMVRAGAAQEYRLREVDTVTDGETIDVPGRPRVVATPGHTRGHASFVLDGTGVLLAGDAIVTHGLISDSRGPQMLARAFHRDVDAARASLDILADQGTSVLLPGHGDPWYGPIAEAVVLAKAKGIA